MKNECADMSKKLSKWPPFWICWRPFRNSASILGDFFLLENVAPSQNLILKCKIPIISIKQGMFILPVRFKPYFYTCACKLIGFSQILPHVFFFILKYFWHILLTFISQPLVELHEFTIILLTHQNT